VRFKAHGRGLVAPCSAQDIGQETARAEAHSEAHSITARSSI